MPPGSLRQSTAHISTYSTIAVVAFAAAFLILFTMLSQAERLVSLGLVGNFYYVLLVPLGLAVAAFLFGVLRSYAVYTGKISGGTVELGGPIVAFVIVVVLGFKLIPNPTPFDLTVFVHGDKGLQDMILRDSGRVILDLGGYRRPEPIGDKGQAYFPGIQSTFRGQAISVTVDAEGYETTTADSRIKVEGDSAYVAIRPKTAELTGYVRSSTGQPVAGATVSVASNSIRTEESGFFKLLLPGTGSRQSLTMQVIANGFDPWYSQVVPGGNEIGVVLVQSTK